MHGPQSNRGSNHSHILKPLITVSDIEGLPSAVRAQWPDVSGLLADTITRVSKYLTFVTRHDPKTPATVEGFVLLESIAGRTHLIRALRNLVREGLSVTAEALAAVADFVSARSKARFEIKHSPTRGLCIRAIAGHTAVLDPTRHLPLMRHDEVLAMGLLPGALMGGKRTHIHLTTYPLNTQGFVEAGAIGHMPSQSTL